MGDTSQGSPTPDGQRDPTTGRFLPGNDGRGGGRPPSIAKRIAELDGGDDKTIRWFIALRDNDKQALGLKKDAPLRERRAAAEWLGDHQHGKAPQPVTGEGGEGPVRVEVQGLVDRLKKLAGVDQEDPK